LSSQNKVVIESGEKIWALSVNRHAQELERFSKENKQLTWIISKKRYQNIWSDKNLENGNKWKGKRCGVIGFELKI